MFVRALLIGALLATGLAATPLPANVPVPTVSDIKFDFRAPVGDCSRLTVAAIIERDQLPALVSKAHAVNAQVCLVEITGPTGWEFHGVANSSAGQLRLAAGGQASFRGTFGAGVDITLDGRVSLNVAPAVAATVPPDAATITGTFRLPPAASHASCREAHTELIPLRVAPQGTGTGTDAAGKGGAIRLVWGESITGTAPDCTVKLTVVPGSYQFSVLVGTAQLFTASVTLAAGQALTAKLEASP